jgi:sugar phosphate isomerase/epimerase
MRVPVSRLSLCHGCMAHVSPPGFISAAAAAGFSRVSLRVTASSLDRNLSAGLATDRRLQQETRARLEELGITLEEAEYAVILPTDESGAHEYLMDAAAALGAHDIVATVSGFENVVDAGAAFANVCKQAADRGLGVLLEFIAITSVRNLNDATALIRESRAWNARITVDILHLIRSGGAPADVAMHGAGLLGMGQLCDAPLRAPPDAAGQLAEMAGQRLDLGEGELPLCEFVAALPREVPIGVEVIRALSLPNDAAVVAHARRLMRSVQALCSDREHSHR